MRFTLSLWRKILLGVLVAVSIFEAGMLIGLGFPRFMFVRGELPGITPNHALASESALDNLTTANDLVTRYYATHQYYKDIYDCDQMAADLWNQAMARGLNAKLVLGSVEKDITATYNGDHAWVAVEISPGGWVALDPTAGNISLASDNPRYYRGIVFDNPAEMMNYIYHYVPGGQPIFTNITPLVKLPLEV
jgi:hypothetical protein